MAVTLLASAIGGDTAVTLASAIAMPAPPGPVPGDGPGRCQGSPVGLWRTALGGVHGRKWSLGRVCTGDPVHSSI